MTKIKDIVSINSQAVLSNAIQLSWFTDATRKQANDELVGGYVFGNSIKDKKMGSHTESSSLPVFEQIRNAFGNPQASNIFTVVARYGHGKSHFALVLANYFGLSPSSPVVENIINHIEICSDKPTADGFRHFKNQTTRPQLVVTLAGTDFQNLRQGFLQALRRALDAHEATRNYSIKSVSAEAAKWLKSLSADDIERADEFLEEKYQTDVDSLSAALERFETGKDVIVGDLSRIFNNGYALNFGADVSLKEIIKDIIDTLCTGADAPFHKMLILFDELGVFTDKWCHHPTASGGLAPQEIFEACLDRTGKVCFVGFVQRTLEKFVKDYAPEIQTEFRKWAGRMHDNAEYHLISNLEDVIGKLLIKAPEWNGIIEDFAIPIQNEAEISRDSIQRYAENWTANDFYAQIAKNCFPLHPLTTGLMCSFEFTEGSRTIIEAVDSMLKSAQEKDVKTNGALNYIRPIELVAEFEQAFVTNKSRLFADFQDVVETALATDTEPIFIDILKALFLFKEARMTKQKRYEHHEILAHLAGYSALETKSALERLQKDFDAVRFSPQKREYEFTGSTTSRKIVLDLANKATIGKRADSFARLLEKLKAFEIIESGDSFNPRNNSLASDFKADFFVEGDEWFLAPRYTDASRLSIEEVKRLCKQNIDDGAARGTVIYLISGSNAELDASRTKAEAIFRQMKEENYPHPCVIAVPTDAAVGLEKQILVKDFIINGMPSPDKVRFAESYRSALEYTNKELNDELIAHLRSVEYIVPEEFRLKFGGRRKSLDEIADAIFSDAYKFRAPSNANSMKPSANTGNTATALIARQLLVNDLNFASFDTSKQTVIKQVLVTGGNSKWGVLDDKFKLREPENARVKEAWSFLGKNVSKDGWTTFDKLIGALTQPPYGYDDYTATLLMAAWIGKHKHELAFKDNRKTSATVTGIQANLKLGNLLENLNKAKDFIRFLRSFVAVQNSGQEIRRAAKEYLEQIREVKDAKTSAELFNQAGQIIQTLADGDELVPQIKNALKDLSEWLKETEGAEKNLAEYQEIINSTSDISTLLRAQKGLNSFGAKNAMQSNAILVETLKEAENKIKSASETQSKINLQRIESYEKVRENLEKSQHALAQAGRADLENLFVAALERIEKDYIRLQNEKNEKPRLDFIAQISVNATSLDISIKNLKRVEEILADNSSPNIEKAAENKRLELKKHIENLQGFVRNLPSRVEAVGNVGAAEELQIEIYQKQNRYENTPEVAEVGTALEKLKLKISEMKAERRRQIEEEKQKATIENIIAQFNRLSDERQRFECLERLVREERKAHLTPEQIQKITDILWHQA